MKKVSVFSITALILTFVVFLITCNRKEQNVSIGFDIPLTGKYDYWGNEFKSGVDIYTKNHLEINVIFEDNQGIPNNVVSIANKLLNINKVDAIVSLFAPFSFPCVILQKKRKNL